MKIVSPRSLVIALAIASVCSGCVLVPFVQAFKESGLTENDRMALLGPQVKKFTDARIFGNKTEALALVTADARPEIAKQLNESSEEERIVKSQIDHVEWIDDARKAKVTVRVDSYKVTQLVVNAVKEEQTWEFNPASGWQLSARTKVEDAA